MRTAITFWLAALAASPAISCSRSEQGPLTTGTVALDERPECPLTDSIIIDTVTVIPVAGPLTHIPEFHDCQRFIHRRSGIVAWIWGKWRYGSMNAVFVSDTVEALWPSVPRGSIQRIDTLGSTRDTLGYNGRIPPSQQPTQQQAPQTHAGNGRVWGEVVNWGGGYDPLGIGAGLNCLVLWVEDTLDLQAYMVKKGMDDPKCAAAYMTIPTGEGVTTLEVRRTSIPGYKITDYPPVARWDWDSVTAQHYISVMCGAGFCEIGNQGFQSSRHHSVGTPSYQNRVVEIKGWYDEQRLATDGPSMIVGTAMPHPDLDQATVADFLGKWDTTARVALPAVNEMYSSTYNFSQASLGIPAQTAGLNTIEMCAETNGECNVPSPAPSCPFPAQDTMWWARITPPTPPSGVSPTPMYKCVLRRGHPKVNKHIPGAVRWRWLANDETTWMRCDQGCCQVY
jgi:hypothetical protein